jgi:hydroxyacylglutathione hydrolase
MLLKYFYDPALAHASYLVGCQRSGEALVVDPGRDVEPYLAAAKAEGLRIVGTAETHIHADFVSGARELSDRAGATLYLSAEGGPDWQYGYVGNDRTQLLKDGDEFHVGKVKLAALHTPGHTPEHLSFVLTDEGGGADQAMGIFTGDFVFVGSIGRPDLLETAAGVVGSADAGARQLHRSVERFLALPDHLQVWPAHGAGSACGKGLGAIPSSTVGYEKLFNPALRPRSEQEFVDYILSDQPETPFYFKEMKRVNKVGPTLLRDVPPPKTPEPERLAGIAGKSLVIDTGSASEFGGGHVPGTINIPTSSLAQWAGFFVDYAKPIHLIALAGDVAANLRSLHSIGIDKVCGVFDADAVRQAGLRTESYESAEPAALRPRIESGSELLLDARAAVEHRESRIKQARHQFVGGLVKSLAEIPKDRPVIVHCQGGGRSAIAASILQRAGHRVTNMKGGIRAWKEAGLPVESAPMTRAL